MRAKLSILLVCLSSLAHCEGLMVVANENVPVSSILSDELEEIYLVRMTHWSRGMPVVPVNREAGSSARETFSDQVLGLSSADISDYWNRLLFEGKRPPLVQNSDQAVVGFVRNVPGAIGYVSGKSHPQAVKILMRLP